MEQQNIHFIGIGGIGMSALAGILLSRGSRVSGSDLRTNNLTDQLAKNGADIYEGHVPSNIDGKVDLVVVSSCIRRDNPELAEAAGRGIPVIGRGELLNRLMAASSVSIAVTGTHGKTTTSALIAHVMESCGRRPTSVIGGEVESLGGNARDGGEGLLVAEVDESDGYFRNIGSTFGVITNIEREHMENYGSMEDLLDAYREFMGRIAGGGGLFYNGEDRVLGEIAGSAGVERTDFGMDGDFTVTCKDVSFGKSIAFDLYLSGKKIGRIESALIGRHNVMNLLAACSVCMKAGLGYPEMAAAVRSFKGVGRRFERIGRVGTIEVIEDYAHHPTEIAAVIRAAKDYADGRVVSVFQPHRHSRTSDLADEFLDCFDGSDLLVLTEVYSADEAPVDGLGIKDIYEKMDRDRFEVLDFISKEDIPERVSGMVSDGDTVLILGAGDIREVSRPLVERIMDRTGREK